MFHVNWKDIEPWPGYRNTCFERDLFAKMLPSDEEAKRFQEYLSWAKVFTIAPGKTMLRHQCNHGVFVYVLDGKGKAEAGGVTKEFRPRDSFQVPADIPHAFINEDDTQAVTLLCLGWLCTRKGQQPQVKDVSEGEGATLDDLAVYNWLDEAKFALGHDGTLWWTGWTHMLGETPEERMFKGHMMCTTPVGVALDPHAHHTGEIYFIEHGQGIMRVGDEEQPVREGSIILIPADEVHAIKSTLEDQQMNILIIATYSEALPFGSDKENVVLSAVKEGTFSKD